MSQEAVPPRGGPDEVEPQALNGVLLVSASPDRSGARVLDASEVAGDVYVFAQRANAAEVRFYLDDPAAEGEPVSVERVEPFDLQGTGPNGVALPLVSSALADGVHTVTAAITDQAGKTSTSSSTFVVNNEGEVNDVLWVSASPDRSGAVLLDGSELSGDAYIFMVPQDAQAVDFLLDGKVVRRERYAFFDFAATSGDGSAYAFDTSELEPGEHTVGARIRRADGEVSEVEAVFTAREPTAAPTPTTPAPDPQPTPEPDPAPEPELWQSGDIGSVTVAGSFKRDGDVLTVVGAGADIWAQSDAFRYVYQVLEGDGELTAKVTGLERSDGWAKAGLMIRGTLEANSPYLAAFLTPDYGVRQQARLSAGAFSSSLAGSTVKAPYWLKVVRQGEVLGTFESADGQSWTQVGALKLSLGSKVYAGLAVTSHDTGKATTATFESVTLSDTVTQSPKLAPEPEPTPSPSPEPEPDPEPQPDPTPEPTPEPDPEPEPTPTPTPTRGSYSLRGDPNFSPSQLSEEQKRWYDTLWAAIKNPDLQPNATDMAKRGDLYHYRGDLYDYVSAILLAFRATGDLRLLDEVDRIGLLMKSKLSDPDGDGFRNWVDLYNTASQYANKDTNEAYDLKANTLVAMIAWALENNRDLRSPAGYNYGADASFWKDYLVNDFEAKWRERNGVPSGFPFSSPLGFHTYHSWMVWHYYMGKLTGNGAYTNEANRMADVLWTKEFTEVSSSAGTAVVFPRGVRSIVSTGNPLYNEFMYMMPQDYARYVVDEAVQLYFEGFNRYASDATLQKFARAFTAFMVDDSSYASFARDIGGGQSRGGIPASSTSWSRMNQTRFAITAWSWLAPWDSSGKVVAAAERIQYVVENVKYGVTPTRVFIPAGMLLNETMKR